MKNPKDYFSELWEENQKPKPLLRKKAQRQVVKFSLVGGCKVYFPKKWHFPKEIEELLNKQGVKIP